MFILPVGSCDPCGGWWCLLGPAVQGPVAPPVPQAEGPGGAGHSLSVQLLGGPGQADVHCAEGLRGCSHVFSCLSSWKRVRVLPVWIEGAYIHSRKIRDLCCSDIERVPEHIFNEKKVTFTELFGGPSSE